MALQDKYCYHPHLLEEETEKQRSQATGPRLFGILNYQPNHLSPQSAILPTHSLSQSSSAEPRLSMCVPEHMKKEKTQPTLKDPVPDVWPEPIDQQTSSQASFTRETALVDNC